MAAVHTRWCVSVSKDEYLFAANDSNLARRIYTHYVLWLGQHKKLRPQKRNPNKVYFFILSMWSLVLSSIREPRKTVAVSRNT